MDGIAPSQVKEKGTIIKAFPPVSFKITIKGDYEMSYRKILQMHSLISI